MGAGNQKPSADFQLDDLDRAILAALPDVGARVGKYLPDAMIVARLRPVVDSSISSGTYGSRLRTLSINDYVVMVKMRTGSRGAGWQRTAKGKLAASIKLN